MTPEQIKLQIENLEISKSIIDTQIAQLFDQLTIEDSGSIIQAQLDLILQQPDMGDELVLEKDTNKELYYNIFSETINSRYLEVFLYEPIYKPEDKDKEVEIGQVRTYIYKKVQPFTEKVDVKVLQDELVADKEKKQKDPKALKDQGNGKAK